MSSGPCHFISASRWLLTHAWLDDSEDWCPRLRNFKFNEKLVSEEAARSSARRKPIKLILAEDACPDERSFSVLRYSGNIWGTWPPSYDGKGSRISMGDVKQSMTRYGLLFTPDPRDDTEDQASVHDEACVLIQREALRRSACEDY